MKPILGIVGGIGSGKSHVASLFARRGAYVIDADHLGHQALMNPDIKKQIKANWGDAVFNLEGQVDRKKLAAIVFSQPTEKARLEAIVFPFIGEGITSAIKRHQADSAVKLFILDAAILLETGWKEQCNAIIFVEASEATRLKRVAGRGWDSQELHRREASQWPLEKKKAACQHVIPNEGDELLTETLVKDLVNLYSRQ
ncbi:MAG TPA: dephospho-CoA kinase [Gemmatales bacterium]|nr:dephospho-CoA kinase [Gemmatales bacterium]